MPATITTEPDRETTLTARPDGSPRPLLLVHSDRVTGADTAGEPLAQPIPGYDRLSGDDAGNDDALWARYESAVAAATHLQETLIAAAAETGDFDAADRETFLTALLTDKTTP